MDDMKLDVNTAVWQSEENDKPIVEKALENLQTLSKGFQRTLQVGIFYKYILLLFYYYAKSTLFVFFYFLSLE